MEETKSMMKMGMGVSRLKDSEAALLEAYRKSLQKIGATKADLCFVFYSYDHGLDSGSLSGAFKKILRDIPHMGCSTWSAWNNRESFQSETGLIVISFKNPSFGFEFARVHSLREKADLWAAELARQISDSFVGREKNLGMLVIFADSLNFTAGNGFPYLEKTFPHIPICGMGTSFSVPQCSVVLNGEVYMNALVALGLTGVDPWVGVFQNIKSELEPITINRMSENLVIEIDQKPAFYKLCEHLMTKNDLPMMSPDEFRKHMGHLYIVEKPRAQRERIRSVGESYRVVPLLGSEMTTGMVAVANALDFNQIHYLGQKKASYAESDAEAVVAEIKKKVPNPSFIWLMISSNRLRDSDRAKSDMAILEEHFPGVPLIGLASNGEYLEGLNQSAGVIIAVP